MGPLGNITSTFGFLHWVKLVVNSITDTGRSRFKLFSRQQIGGHVVLALDKDGAALLEVVPKDRPDLVSLTPKYLQILPNLVAKSLNMVTVCTIRSGPSWLVRSLESCSRHLKMEKKDNKTMCVPAYHNTATWSPTCHNKATCNNKTTCLTGGLHPTGDVDGVSPNVVIQLGRSDDAGSHVAVIEPW